MSNASDITLSAFAKLVDETIDGANDTLANGAIQLVERPQHTLEWSDRLFKAAAQLEVYTGIQSSLNLLKECVASGEKTTADATEYFVRVAAECQKRVIQRAKSPKRSTSATANLLEQEIVSVYADLAEQMDCPGLYGLTRDYA